MKFDKSKVYTALNADELKVGSTVVVANDLSSLKTKVQFGSYSVTLLKIWGTSSTNRFEVTSMNDGLENRYNLCYLISSPKEKKPKWTDLKLGDIITNGNKTCIITLIDATSQYHILAGGYEWLSDEELDEWEKVEK